MTEFRRPISIDSENRVTELLDNRLTPAMRREARINKIIIFFWTAIAIAGFVCFLGDLCSR